MQHRTSPEWALRLDWLLVLLLIAIPLVELTGGFTTSLAGVRLSVRSSSRLLFWFVLLSAVRHLWCRRPTFLEHLENRGWLRRDSAPAPRLQAGAAEWFRACAYFAGVVALMAHAQILAPLGVPDYGDPLFSVWRLAWVARSIVAQPLQLFDGNIFHPEPGTLAYSDAMILPSLVAGPLFWLEVPRVGVYNALLLTSFVASGVSLYFFVSRLTGSRAAGLVSGTIFSLYPFRFEHYSHLELQMTMWAPPAAWVLHRLVRNGRLSSGVVLGLVLAAQMFSSLYFGVYLAIYLAVLGAALMALSGVRPIIPRLGGLAAAAAVLFIAVTPLAVPYVQNQHRLGERSPQENIVYSATLSDYAKAHSRSWTYGRRLETGSPERCLFPGITPVVLALGALVPPINTVRAAYGIALFVSLDASLGFNAGLYPVLYDWLLPLRGLRVPARFSLFVGLTLAILAGLAVHRFGAMVSRRWRTALAVVATALVLIEYRPALALQPVWADLPPVYGPLVGRPPAVLAVFPMSHEPSDNAAKYMYFSTWHWHQLLNGYSGNFPSSYRQLIVAMRDFPNPSAVDYLQERGVEFIVLHGEFARPVDQEKAAKALDEDSRLELLGVFPAQPSASRLYRFRETERR